MATTNGRNGNGHGRNWTEEDWNDLYHTGPDTLSGKYMRLFWQPVQRSDELAPGKAKPVRIMSEDLTVYRAQDGTPHVVDFRCAGIRPERSMRGAAGRA
ncbi:MAG: Rieske (2Fe-2S) domain protein [Chloroflexi bacterium]|nr:Rieske (2Fe-2S) domain protein [Chloroflexota bacterium]